MPTLGIPVFNLETPCQEQELIRWKSALEHNFKIKKTPNENKAAFIRGWIDDTGVYKLRKIYCSDNECDTYDKIIPRFEQVI